LTFEVVYIKGGKVTVNEEIFSENRFGWKIEVAGFARNSWQVCTGITGRFQPESVAGLSRNTH